MHFKNQVVWITGASAGIGAELARQLSGLGAKLILTARNEGALEVLRKSCDADAAVLPADLTTLDDPKALVSRALQCFGRIDILIHSAGQSQRALAQEAEPATLRHLLELNFFAPTLLTQAVLPTFQAQRGGSIVAISSVAGLYGAPLRSGYAAAKHALKGWMESLQTEQSTPGLHVLLVFPGRIRTEISTHALRADGTPHGQVDKGQLQGIPVERCAEKIIRALYRKKKRLLIARGERVLWWLWFWLPATYYRLAHKKGF